jgi:predicted  nucleic acid-binding Zn-ribbon protein
LNSKLRAAIPVLLALSVAVLLFVGVDRLLERQRISEEVTRLRGELFQARAAAERCQGGLANSEARLRDFDEVIGTLRARVDSFEALDTRGVPEEEYDAYMESFESYNDSVAAWEDRAQRLRTAEASCRATIERHNALRDTLRGVMEGAGLVPADTTE